MNLQVKFGEAYSYHLFLLIWTEYDNNLPLLYLNLGTIDC